MQVRRAYTDEEIKTAELDANKNLDWMKKTYQVFWLHCVSSEKFAALCEVDLTDSWIDKEAVLNYIGKGATTEEYFASAVVDYYGPINCSPTYFDNERGTDITDHQLIEWSVDLSLNDREQGIPYRFIEIAEDANWNVEMHLGYIAISQYSPEGQDVYFEISGKNESEYIGGLYQICKSFDPAEEASYWIENGLGSNGAPDDPVDVLKDMRWVQMELEKLYLELAEEKKERYFTIPVTHKMTGKVTVAADSIADALNKIQSDNWNDHIIDRVYTEESVELATDSLLDLSEPTKEREGKKCQKR